MFVGIDLPYFVTKNHWDNEGFVGVSEDALTTSVLEYLEELSFRRNMMAVVFGSFAQVFEMSNLVKERPNWQTEMLFVNRKGIF